jgi:gamma-glutamyltranspeptidase / glutathione hydrolase
MTDITIYRKRKVKAAQSRYGMVSTASPQATEAGVRMLEKGGNAVDAAVAAAFCLGVSEFQSSGLGGQSMVLLHHCPNGEPQTIALDGSSRAPFGINPNCLPDKPLNQGIKSTTVPSTPATLGYLLETYGTLPLEEVLKPSILVARNGFKISALQRKLFARDGNKLKDKTVRSIFYRDGNPLNTGDIVRQPQLSSCMEQMVKRGWRDFYLGEIGEQIIADMKKRGGLITRADLRQIPFPVRREALKGSYRGIALATFPPPGAGRALVQILNTLENFKPEELDFDSPLPAVLLAMTFRAALVKSERFPIDPALYPQVGDKWLTDKKSALSIASRIKTLVPYLDDSHFVPPPTSGETTHISVADVFGNLVGITQSIEMAFGAKTMAAELGFFYNNYMSAFNYKNMMHPSYLVPGGRPWSSVAPTLLFRDSGKPFLLLGSPGSERISTTLAQVISRIIDLNQDLTAAIDAPRLHAGSSGKVMIEKRSYRPEVVDALNRAGFEVSRRGAYSFYLGCVQAVKVPESEGGLFTGVSDPRRDGNARGPRALPSINQKTAPGTGSS